MEKQVKQTDAPVCVFDSGIGGLNLLAECVRLLPWQDFVYVADNYNVPYGNLPTSHILSLARAAFDKINSLNPSAAVVACNTVTAQCIQTLREEYAFPIVGIQPAVKQAAKLGGKCLVLATQATIDSSPFNRLKENYLSGDAIIYPCRDLADYIENNIFSLPDILPETLLPSFNHFKPDSVVLGCTHYCFVKKQIQKKYKCEVFDGILGTANHLVKILGNVNHNNKNIGKINFICGNYSKNKQIYYEVVSKL
jgi:glutamate racemase